MEKIICEGCKIWNKRYGLTNELCPRCMGIELDRLFLEYDRAYKAVMKEIKNETNTVNAR